MYIIIFCFFVLCYNIHIMFRKIILIVIIVTGLYAFNHLFTDSPTTLPSYAPGDRVERPLNPTAERVKEFVLKFLPAKEQWPEPAKVMYYMVFMDEVIRPIQTRKDYLPLDSLGTDLQHAVIAVEDHDFYSHSAVSINSVIRALMVNTSAGEVLEGGSTLTQQLVKNLFLTNEQTMSRKALEAMLALVMENKYSKDEILEIYLNSVYFGMNCYGANQATDKLFNKAPIILRLEEAALIAGLPNAPSALNPFENSTGAKKRQEVVLDAMQRYGFITQSQCWKAKSAEIYLSDGTILVHDDKVVL